MLHLYYGLFILCTIPLHAMESCDAPNKPQKDEQKKTTENSEKNKPYDELSAGNQHTTPVCLKQFGVYKTHDLDCQHQKLAQTERQLSTELYNSDNPHKQQNLVIGELTLFIANQDKECRVLSVPLNRCFESRLDYDKEPVLLAASSTGLVFDKKLLEFLPLFDYFKRLWPKDDKQAVFMRINEISTVYENLKNKVRTHASALKELIGKLEELSGITDSHLGELESWRNLLFDKEEKGKKKSKPSSLFRELAHISSHALIGNFENLEKDLRIKMFNFYKDFWHAEQRLIWYLLYSESLWENIKEKLGPDDTITGVLVHIHSRFNFCSRCRNVLESAMAPLKEHIEQMLQEYIDKHNWFFKLCASFRIHYFDEEKEGAHGSSVISPYRIMDPQLTIESPATSGNVFFIKREACHADDEHENDIRALNILNPRAMQEIYERINLLLTESKRGSDEQS